MPIEVSNPFAREGKGSTIEAFREGGRKGGWRQIGKWAIGLQPADDLANTFGMGDTPEVDWQAQYPGQAQSMDPATLRDIERARAAQINTALQNQFRQRQMALAGSLEAQSRGEGPSVAQQQLRAGLDRSQNAARSLAISDPRMSPAMANRMGQLGLERMALQTNQQAAQLRAQEQLQAQQQLGALLAGARGQDIGMATSQAGFEQQAGLANAGAYNQAGLAQAKLDQEAAIANMKAQLAQEEIAAGLQAKEADVAMAEAGYGTQQTGGILGAAGSIIGQLVSDKRAKKDIKKVRHEDTEEMLDAMEPYSYKYKDKRHGEGLQHGIMAQDAEKSKMGRSFVERRPDGLRQLNVPRQVQALMAAALVMHKRLKKLERK